MRIYANAAGDLVGMYTDADIERFGDHPQAAMTFEFDEDTTPSVVEAIGKNWQGHKLRNQGGQIRLVREGDQVAIQADGPRKRDKPSAAMLAKLNSGTPLTDVEIKALFRHLLRKD